MYRIPLDPFEAAVQDYEVRVCNHRLELAGLRSAKDAATRRTTTLPTRLMNRVTSFVRASGVYHPR
jgi:hypothetical protein